MTTGRQTIIIALTTSAICICTRWTRLIAPPHFELGPDGEQIAVERNEYVVERQPGFEVKYGLGLGEIYYKSECLRLPGTASGGGIILKL